MKRFVKFNTISVILVFILSILVGCLRSGVLGAGKTANVKLAGTTKVEDMISDEYKEWAALPKEERDKKVMPKIAKTPETTADANMVGSSYIIDNNVGSRYDYRDEIANNTKIKDQEDLDLCWDFATLGCLETSLALENKKNNTNTNKEYDFSEKYLDIVSTYQLKDGTNYYGVNRALGSANSSLVAMAELANGQGVINEETMPYETTYAATNSSGVSTSELGKINTAQVTDFIEFEKFNKYQTPSNDLKNKMKSHLKNYGGIIGYMYSDLSKDYTNMETGAVNVNNTNEDSDHAILLVGWDDDYSKDNFKSSCKPSNDGAWIVKNSWGEKDYLSIEEVVYLLKHNGYADDFNLINDNFEYNSLPDVLKLTVNTAIVRDLIKYNNAHKDNRIHEDENENDINKRYYFNRGDNGFFYISYEDKLLYEQLIGIINADDEVSPHIYQYNETGYGLNGVSVTQSGSYLNTVAQAVVFDRDKSNSTEYIDKVALYGIAGDNYEVYINPTGDSMNWNNLQRVQIKDEDASINYNGYHTINFKNDIALPEGCNKFVVVVNVTNNVASYTDIDDVVHQPVAYYGLEIKANDLDGQGNDIFKYVKTEANRSYISTKNNNEWTSIKSDINSVEEDADLTIKAFVKGISQSEEIDPGEDEPSNVVTGKINASTKIDKFTVYYENNKFRDDYTLDVIVKPNSGNFDPNMNYSYYITKNGTQNNTTNNYESITDFTVDSQGRLHFTIPSRMIPESLRNDSDAENLGFLHVKGIDQNNNTSVETGDMKLDKNDITENNAVIKGDNGEEISLKDLSNEMSNKLLQAFGEMFGLNNSGNGGSTTNTTSNSTSFNVTTNTTNNNSNRNTTTNTNSNTSKNSSNFKTVTGSTDITVANKDIPQTGEKDFFIGFGVTFVIGIGLIAYINYRRIRVR